MDSLSQIGLGAAVGVAVMGRRTAVWKAALWGAVGGTLPDLDVFIDYGDPILNMVLHRAETHSLFWLSLFSVPFAAAVVGVTGERDRWRRWWLAMWLVLITHPLLDSITVYGTQLGLPFTSHPYAVGSIFIIDPLYTLPLLLGVGWALFSRQAGGGGLRDRLPECRLDANGSVMAAAQQPRLASKAGLRANAAGLVLSSLYLVWSVWAQSHATAVAIRALSAQGIQAERLLVTPTAFNTVLWRVVAVQGEHHYEGFYGLLDPKPDVQFDRFDRGQALAQSVQQLDGVRRIMAFSHGFYSLREQDGRVLISDLRMGQEPNYVFSFAVAQAADPAQAGAQPQPLATSEQVGGRPDVQRSLRWLWRRVQGEVLSPPR